MRIFESDKKFPKLSSGSDGFGPAITNNKIFQNPDKLTNTHFLLEKARLLVRFLLSLTRR
jgi:hypothetical protein